jgi:hypothetical protein
MSTDNENRIPDNRSDAPKGGTPRSEKTDEGAQNPESDRGAGGTSGHGPDDPKGVRVSMSADSIRFLLVAALVFVAFVAVNILALVWFSIAYQEWRDAAEASLERIERRLGTSFCRGDRESLDDVIYFSESKHSLDAEPSNRKKRNDEALQRLAYRLGRARGTGVILVIGTASPDGDVVDNLLLSERRAHEVVRALKRETEPLGNRFRAHWRFVAIPHGESYENPGGPGSRLPKTWRDKNRKAWVELCRHPPHPRNAREYAGSWGGGLPAHLRLGLLLGVFALAATLWWKAARTGEPAFLLLGSLQAGVAFVAGLSAWWWDTPANHLWAGLVLGLHTTTAPYPFTVQNAIWIVLFLLAGNFGATLEAGKVGGQWARNFLHRVRRALPGLHRSDGG